MTMNDEHKSDLAFAEKLSLLHIDPDKQSLQKRKRSPTRKYTVADLIPVEDLSFHWLQATTINDDVPVWNPDKTVVSYLGDFVPAKKLKSAAKSCIQDFNYPCNNTVNCNISDMGTGYDKTLNVAGRQRVSANNDTVDAKSKVKVSDKENTLNVTVGN